jgi:predicted membrane-bound mannosyltransferase
MKRILFGVFWFIVALFAFTLVDIAVIGVSIASIYHPIGVDAGVKAGLEFSKNHSVFLTLSRITVVLSAAVLAIAGTLHGALPGTRRSDS